MELKNKLKELRVAHSMTQEAVLTTSAFPRKLYPNGSAVENLKEFFSDRANMTYMQLLTMAKQGYFDEQANAGNTQCVLYKKVYEDYTARGGKIDSVDTFDFRLYTDVNAKVELHANT